MYKSVTIPVESKPRTNITRIVRPALANQCLNVDEVRGQAVEHLAATGEMTLDEIA